MTPIEQTQPHNLEAERSILGAIIVRNDAIATVIDIITARDFYPNAHQQIFGAMLALHEQSIPIDFVTLKHQLGDQLEAVGGPAYVAKLADGMPTSTNVEYYARIVKDHALRRHLISVGNRAVKDAYADNATPEEIADRMSQALSEATSPRRDDQATRGPAWPAPLTAAAYHGPLGELVRLVEPHSEADPAALLVQAIVIFGNILGQRAHFDVCGARHSLSLYTVLVGLTSKGRKGTSYNSIALPLKGVDPTLKDPERVVSGLSSGEGLIWSVRDPVVKGSETVDTGVIDKRKLVVEGEFASVLKQFAREGNILSAVVRQAWDSGSLGTLTKANTAKATGALISIIGHITKDELTRYLTATEAGNGFGNRFLWCCTQRSKELPEGGELHRVDFGPVVRRLLGAVAFANQDLELKRDEAAKQLWASVYHDLSEGHPGLFGAMTSRAEAQVLRIAGVYALADVSDVVTVAHLEAALAVWQYCNDSALFIFGASLGDPLVDELDGFLRGAGRDGCTRTQLRDLFGRNRKGDQIDRGLRLLQEHGRARQVDDRSKPGRPPERWIHTSHDRNDQSGTVAPATHPLVVGRKSATIKTGLSSYDLNDITTIESQSTSLRPTTKLPIQDPVTQRTTDDEVADGRF